MATNEELKNKLISALGSNLLISVFDDVSPDGDDVTVVTFNDTALCVERASLLMKLEGFNLKDMFKVKDTISGNKIQFCAFVVDKDMVSPAAMPCLNNHLEEELRDTLRKHDGSIDLTDLDYSVNRTLSFAALSRVFPDEEWIGNDFYWNISGISLIDGGDILLTLSRYDITSPVDINVSTEVRLSAFTDFEKFHCFREMFSDIIMF